MLQMLIPSLSFLKSVLFLNLTPSLKHIKSVAERLHNTGLFLKMAGYLLHFISVVTPLHILSCVFPPKWFNHSLRLDCTHKLSTQHWKCLERAVIYCAEGESSITTCSKSAPLSDKEVKRKVIEGWHISIDSGILSPLS